MTNNWTATPRDPWFSLGRLKVGSTMFVVLWVVVSWIANVLWSAITATPSGLTSLLAFNPWLVLQGQVWRIVSWPLANPLNFWAVVNLFFFHVFGSELEEQVGRTRMARLLLGIWAALLVASTVVGLGFHASSWLAGVGQIQFLLFLVWIADNPQRMFLFNIPAWVVGAVLVALQVLQMVAGRDLFGILELLIGFALVAVLARSVGLLGSLDWIPGRPRQRTRAPKVGRAERRQQQKRVDDTARLDELLDKISAQGMDSLTPAEHRELMRLRNRRS